MGAPATRDYWLAPFEKTTEDGLTVYAPPAGVVGVIDLRTVLADVEFGFFVTPAGTAIPDGRHLGQGDLRELAVDRPMWSSMLGIAVEGATVMDALEYTLTVGADPDGEAAPFPLMPTVAGNLDIHLGGHSLVRRRRFDLKAAHAAPVIERLQRDYRRIREAARAGRLNGDERFHRRVLDYWGEKFRIDDPEDVFIPRDLPRERRLRHQTSVADSFDRADEALGTGGAWAVLGNGFGTPSLAVVSNTCRADLETNTDHFGQYQTALSGADHYGEVDVTLGGAPGSGRVYGSAEARCADNGGWHNSYSYQGTKDSAGATHGRLGKFTGAPTSFTELADAAKTIATGDTIRCEADGSSISGYINDVLQAGPITDTSLSSGLLVGLGIRIRNGTLTSAILDNFAGADLGVGGDQLFAGAVAASATPAAAFARELLLAGAVSGGATPAAAFARDYLIAGAVAAQATPAASFGRDWIFAGDIVANAVIEGSMSLEGLPPMLAAFVRQRIAIALGM